ncbi:MAG: biopolymer transporter ExbD [Verrucomicrobia bacterium]|nr:biopolymer transporter ExbD [Verrucomicrobiota bacterium]
MRFTNPKRRQPPPVIIISLIDVLIIMLIFLMVTTTFKQHPAVKITLPESSQPREGVTEDNLVVTIAKSEPYFSLGPLPVTLDRLRQELRAHVAKKPQATLAIRPDKEAPIQKLIDVLGAAKEAGMKTTLPLYVTNPGQP